MRIAKKIRFFFGKRILKSIGQDVNIERGATFDSKVEIGEKSGLGVNCVVLSDQSELENLLT